MSTRRPAPVGATVEPAGIRVNVSAETSEPGTQLEPGHRPTLYVCHGDDGGVRFHPCRRVQEAMRAKGIEYDKVIAGYGSPFPFRRKGSRDKLVELTGDRKLPALKLADGTVLRHSRAILRWVAEQPERGASSQHRSS